MLERTVAVHRVEDDIVGRSAAFLNVLNQVRIIAKSDSVTLIQGETGTGKEVIARAIHNQSLRSRGPFVKLNCAAIPSALLESELFGHERGAFTGAVTQTMGRFQQADNGTLFLDEIGDLPLELQPKLLRALQEQEFERLGCGRTIRVNVRVVAATNQDLAQLVSARQFRADLYYRLNVIPIFLPPLRERLDDIPPISRTLRSNVRSPPQQTDRHDSRRSDGTASSPTIGRATFASCRTSSNAPSSFHRGRCCVPP